MSDESTNASGYMFVSRIVYGEEEVETTPIKVPDFQGVPVARVAVSSHVTKNLGNYESARVGIEVSLPCLPTEAEIARAYDIAQNLVGDMLEEQLSGLSK